MKKVGRGDYLYVREGVFYFRRGVPADALAAFGRSEVVKSLGTRQIAEARHRLAAELRQFEQILARVRRVVAPIECVAQTTGVPSLEDLEVGVRVWLKERNERAAQRLAVLRPEEEVAAVSSLRGERDFLEKAGVANGLEPPLDTDWIAGHLIEQNGWEIEDGSPLYRRLKRVILQGQIEANERARQEMLVEPVRVLDDRFAAHAYLADQQKGLTGRPQSLQNLLDGYLAERKPKPATAKAYRLQFEDFRAFVGHDDARAVTGEDVVRWKAHLVGRLTRKGVPLTARTIRDKYLVVVKAVFAWAVKNSDLVADPAKSVTIKKPKRQRLRGSDLTDQEARTILAASLAAPPARMSAPMARARRWVPWLCAYTGARVNEMTQLRAEDVQAIDGIWTVRITPEAGSVKDDQARVIPIHSHVIAQGFLAVVEQLDGPLFYDPSRHRGGSDGNPQRKKVGERLASWVREIGVDDPNVQPNHGWRHRFITMARRLGMPEEVRRDITGHTSGDTDFTYGAKPIDVLQREIEKFPRYDL